MRWASCLDRAIAAPVVVHHIRSILIPLRLIMIPVLQDPMELPVIGAVVQYTIVLPVHGHPSMSSPATSRPSTANSLTLNPTAIPFTPRSHLPTPPRLNPLALEFHPPSHCVTPVESKTADSMVMSGGSLSLNDATSGVSLDDIAVGDDGDAFDYSASTFSRANLGESLFRDIVTIDEWIDSLENDLENGGDELYRCIGGG